MDKIFETHKNLNSCYKTSDGKAFYTANHAQNHAKSLKDKTVLFLEREITATDEKSKDPNDAEKALSKMNKTELTAKAASLGIEVKDEKNADIIILIEDKLKEATTTENGNDNEPTGE